MVSVRELLDRLKLEATVYPVAYELRCERRGKKNSLIRIDYVGKSALVQTGSAVIKYSHKDLEVYW